MESVQQIHGREGGRQRAGEKQIRLYDGSEPIEALRRPRGAMKSRTGEDQEQRRPDGPISHPEDEKKGYGLAAGEEEDEERKSAEGPPDGRRRARETTRRLASPTWALEATRGNHCESCF